MAWKEYREYSFNTVPSLHNHRPYPKHTSPPFWRTYLVTIYMQAEAEVLYLPEKKGVGGWK